MSDVEEAEKLMHQRDHSALLNEKEQRFNHLGLADTVPGLVREIRDLREALGNLLAEQGSCNDKEKGRGYCAGHANLMRLPCPVAEARKVWKDGA